MSIHHLRQTIGFARSPFPDRAHGAGVTVYVNSTAARRLLAIQRPGQSAPGR